MEYSGKYVSGIKFDKCESIGRAFWVRTSKNKKETYILCKCNCGEKFVARTANLANLHTKGCGCKITGKLGGICVDNHELYGKWKGMIERCKSDAPRKKKYYKDRGISVCEEWLGSFRSFLDWSMDNGFKAGLEIDRIDNNGSYEPGNCRFVTKIENMNNRRMCHMLTAFGETKTLTQWSRDGRCKVGDVGLLDRIRRGMRPEDAITAEHKNIRMISAFGETKSLKEWSKDERCMVSDRGLVVRMNAGELPEIAMSRKSRTLMSKKDKEESIG